MTKLKQVAAALAAKSDLEMHPDTLEEMARAAIEAMREPTEAMLNAARDHANQSYIPNGSWAWDVMIDAALKEAPK